MDTSLLQMMFYVVSPVGTFLAVFTAYLALTKQSKPLVLVYYEPSSEVGSFIDLIICNHGNGTARNINFSKPIPIRCYGIERPDEVRIDEFMTETIPVLAAGKELRFSGGQYGGIFSVIGSGQVIDSTYEYKSPLRFSKRGCDQSLLSITYMQRMISRNSAAHDLSDAMKGKNNTVFAQINKQLRSIDSSLKTISKSFDSNNDRESN